VATLAHSGGQTAGVNGAELVEEHGMLLQAATGPIPNLPSLVVGEPVKGSWWGHPEHDEIFRVLNEAADSSDVVRLKLVDGKVTLVHRRLWPALVRLADELGPDRLAAIEEEHTASGAHRSTVVSFPSWVPSDVLAVAGTLSRAEAVAELPECARP
jgi:hypothetical protein